MIEVAINTDKQISCKDIQRALNAQYINNCSYKIENVYLFKDDWESDFVVIKTNGYVYEFEIKLSRSDFLADFKKKTKHDILRDGKFIKYKWGEKNVNGEIKEHQNRPNRFYYVSTPGLISRHELPPYAGLITIDKNNCAKKVKEASFIHREVIDYEKKLARKFYSRMLNERYENRQKEFEIEDLKREIKKLKNISL